MAGYRWDMPIFLIDGLFSTAEGHRLSERCDLQVASKLGLDAEQILLGMKDAIAAGYTSHALQRSPHMILLDQIFYDRQLRPLLARWALVWMAERFTGRVAVSLDVLIAYLEGYVSMSLISWQIDVRK